MHSMRTFRISALLTLLLVGCGGIHHLDRNAPGEANIEEPPEEIATGERSKPADPGEQAIEILASPFYAFGEWTADSGRVRPTHTLGLEVTALYLQNAESHKTMMFSNTLCERCELYPTAGAGGGSLGIELLNWTPNSRSPKPRRVYAEANLSQRPTWTLGAGWNLDTETGGHGPRVSAAAFDVFSFQFSHTVGRGVSGYVFFQYTYGEALVWSR